MKSVKKRPKASRHRGSHTHSRGAKKKARGSGHRGGIGKAGTGKKADQKKGAYGSKYFGKRKVTRARAVIKLKDFNLQVLVDNLENFVKKSKAKKEGAFYEIDLKEFKIIGNVEIKDKLKINAGAASKGAVEAVKKAGGEIILPVKKNSSKEKVKDVKEKDSEEKK